MSPVQLKHPSSSFCNNLCYAYNCNQFMFAHLTNFTLYIYTHIYIYSCVCVYMYMHACVKIVAIFFCHILHMGFWPFVTLDQFIKILGHYSVLMFLINWLLFAIVEMYKLCFIYYIFFPNKMISSLFQAFLKPISSWLGCLLLYSSTDTCRPLYILSTSCCEEETFFLSTKRKAELVLFFTMCIYVWMFWTVSQILAPLKVKVCLACIPCFALIIL